MKRMCLPLFFGGVAMLGIGCAHGDQTTDDIPGSVKVIGAGEIDAAPGNDTGTTDAGPQEAGVIFVELGDDTFPQQIMLGGTGQPQLISSYIVTNLGQTPVRIDGLTIQQPWSGPGYGAADQYTSIGISLFTPQNQVGCGGVGTLQPDLSLTAKMSGCPAMLLPGDSASIYIGALLPAPVTTAGSDQLSGDILGLGLVSLDVLNAQVIFDGYPAPQLIVRKSVPYVTPQALPAGPLADGDQDLISFMIGADPAGDIAWKQLVLHVSVSGMTLSNFGLRRGTAEIDAGTLAITGVSGADLMTGPLTAIDDHIAVSFRPGIEETVLAGTGTTYTLHAIASGISSASSISLQVQFPENLIETGALASQVALPPFVPDPNIFVVVPNVAPNKPSESPIFVWSDRSAGTSHSPDVDGGSSDWTNEAFIYGLMDLSP